MTIAEHLTATRLLSWSDRNRHLQKLKQAFPEFAIESLQKIYLLGYSKDDEQTVQAIGHCAQLKCAHCIKRIFAALPYGEDELGLMVVGDILTLYLLLPISGNPLLCAVNSNYKTVFESSSPGFPYFFLFGKRIVYPPLSLLPQS